MGRSRSREGLFVTRIDKVEREIAELVRSRTPDGLSRGYRTGDGRWMTALRLVSLGEEVIIQKSSRNSPKTRGPLNDE